MYLENYGQHSRVTALIVVVLVRRVTERFRTRWIQCGASTGTSTQSHVLLREPGDSIRLSPSPTHANRRTFN